MALTRSFIHLNKGIVLAALAVSIYACKGGDNKEQMLEEDEASEFIKGESAEKVFYSMPSPIETAVLLKKAGANYDKEVLNLIENKDKYQTISSKALNLGVYGSDLSYTTIFDKTQEAMLYLACTKKLADGLGISQVFSDDVVGRMEANMSNRDSLLRIISDSYWEADSYLKENDRANVSALLIAGGWIEGLYIATKVEESLRKSNTNQMIIERIAEQKHSLDNLINLLDAYKGDETIAALSAQLKDVKTDFDKVSIEESEGVASTDKSTGVAVIGGNTTISIADDVLAAISAKIKKIRTGIVQ
jgi:hypothetical protein